MRNSSPCDHGISAITSIRWLVHKTINHYSSMFVCTFNGIHGEQVVFLVTCWLLRSLVSWLPVCYHGACCLG